MSAEIQKFDGPDGQPEVTARKPPKVNILKRLHRHMRGYYLLGALIGAVLVPAGAYYGYKSNPPSYRSSATLRITPLTLRILYAQSDVAPSIFDGFVDVQVSIMKSRTLIESLMNNPEWVAARGKLGAMDPEVFLRNLDITHPVRSEIVNITYTDSSPELAMLGNKLLIEEYLKLHGDRKGNQRIIAAEERSDSLAAKVSQTREKMMAIANEYGAEDLRDLHQAKVQELARIESMLKDTEINLLLAEAALGNADINRQMPISEIASHDEILRRTLDESSQVDVQLSQLLQEAGEEHPAVVALRAKQEHLKNQVSERAEAFRNFRRTSFVNNVGVLEGAPTPAAIDSLRTRRDKLKKMYDESLAKSMEIGRKNLQAVSLGEELKQYKERFAENQSKLEQLRVDSAVIGQINLINEPDRPAGPIKDRRKSMAGAGGFVAFLLGFGALAAYRLTDRRIRLSKDLAVAAPETAMLASFPSIDGPKAEGLAMNAMQQLMLSLKIDSELRNARVIAVTGARSGAGSSDVASALAMAFATSGKRTLLVDLDTKAAGLSRMLNDRADFAPIDHRQTVQHILAGQAIDADALRTPIDSLWFLGIGLAENRPVIEHREMIELFSSLAGRFDILIVDATAPSENLETLLVGQTAETMLVCVDPQTTDPQVRQSLTLLKNAGVSIGGLVYNKATARETSREPEVTPLERSRSSSVKPFGKLMRAIWGGE